MLKQVISGGQTGVDQAALAAAKRVGLETGGVMPRGWPTEAGPRPDLGQEYGLVELSGGNQASRTRANVRLADGTVCIVGAPLQVVASGMARTRRAVAHYARPAYWTTRADGRPDALAHWIGEQRIAVLNVAGNRESNAPGIRAWAEEYLAEVFRLVLAAGSARR
jgi:hypothetical protein